MYFQKILKGISADTSEALMARPYSCHKPQGRTDDGA